MADQWNDNIPTLGGTISTQYPDVEENFGWIQRVFQMLIGWKTSDIATVSPPGPQRSKFDYSSTTAIVINPGVYFHDGTTRQTVFWDAAITFTAGSGGSNAGSTDLGVSQRHYLYLDDSAIITQASPELDADCFLNSTTAPTWSDAKHGWYNGSDRCIFGFFTNGSNQILEFAHDGGELVHFATHITEFDGLTLTTSFADLDMSSSLPGFCTKGDCLVKCQYVDGNAGYYWKTKGATDTTGSGIGRAQVGATVGYNTFAAFTDSSQVIQHKEDAATANTYTVVTFGFYLPTGM